MIYYKGDKFISENRGDVSSCPVCNNRMGFVFGTCVQCGFNHIEAEFNHIKVYVDDLPTHIRDRLIRKHVEKYDVEAISERAKDHEFY